MKEKKLHISSILIPIELLHQKKIIFFSSRKLFVKFISSNSHKHDFDFTKMNLNLFEIDAGEK